MQVQFEALCGPNIVHDILGPCRRSLVVVNALNRLSISCFVPKIYTLAGIVYIVVGLHKICAYVECAQFCVHSYYLNRKPAYSSAENQLIGLF